MGYVCGHLGSRPYVLFTMLMSGSRGLLCLIGSLISKRNKCIALDTYNIGLTNANHYYSIETFL